jgi:hypothetical protein
VCRGVGKDQDVSGSLDHRDQVEPGALERRSRSHHADPLTRTRVWVSVTRSRKSEYTGIASHRAFQGDASRRPGLLAFGFATSCRILEASTCPTSLLFARMPAK